MKRRVARRPAHISISAEACLQALASRGLGDRFSIGGGFGPLHYLDYRPTHDVHAWWAPSTTALEQEQILTVIEDALRSFGDVRRRSWGEVVSVECRQGERTSFSFQIAQRSAQLQASEPAPWADVLLNSLPDLVASKMVALVERGAPRDIRDIHALCQAKLVTAAECWRLWRRRQQLSGSDTSPDRARLAIETHLARVAQHRPLARITDPPQRAAAEQVRLWLSTEFLDALVD
jgi:hypothetical protein